MTQCVYLTAVMAALSATASPFALSASRESFDMVVSAPPVPVTIEGREWLIYELHLTNFAREPLRVTSIDVLAGSTDVLQSVEPSRASIELVHPRERAVVYIELPAHAPPPTRLRHRVRYRSESTREVADVSGAEVKLDAKARQALGPPLRGGPWAAVYAWEWPRGHRRMFYTLDGRARVPGRFAIDWVRRDEQGRSAREDADLVKNSLGYGAEVLAVADARVAALRDDVTESERVSANPKHSLDDAAGNYLSLDLGDGRFAIYEHLAPGSIRVAKGERVRRGQVIASLGFTGDSTEPHLHFHVADGPSPLSAEGLPFEIDRFRVLGGVQPDVRRRERPAPNSTVTFD